MAATRGHAVLAGDAADMGHRLGGFSTMPNVVEGGRRGGGHDPLLRDHAFKGNGSTLAHDEAYARDDAGDGERRLEVPAEPLDVHLGRFATIDLVKIDVEGGGEQVFAGMEALVGSGAVRICFER